MAVYTHIDKDEIKAFLRPRDLGDYISHEGIVQGVENTNYKLTTTIGVFILTLIEKRTAPEDLPFIFSFVKHLKKTGLNVPDTLAEGMIAGKPAAIIRFLPGKDVPDATITEDHCAQVGSILAWMHKASETFKGERANPVGPKQWQSMFDALVGKIDKTLEDVIARELAACACDDWHALPRGAVHVDLFPDNVFFDQGKLSGVIDFYFSCISAYVYDTAIVLNAWCYDDKANERPGCVKAFLDAYESVRPLNDEERTKFPALRRAAALRFLMTRLYDWIFTPKDATVNKKDFNEYLNKLKIDFTWPTGNL